MEQLPRRLPAGGSHSTSRASNTADGRLSPCPKGVTEPRHCRVATLDKGPAIACEAAPEGSALGVRLALARLGGSEPGNITLKEYYSLLAIFLDLVFGVGYTAEPFFFAQTGVAAVR